MKSQFKGCLLMEHKVTRSTVVVLGRGGPKLQPDHGPELLIGARPEMVTVSQMCKSFSANEQSEWALLS
jgi:hypothetical protein